MRKVRGSFRDPDGEVFDSGHLIYRTVNQSARKDFEYVRSADSFKHLLLSGKLIPEKTVDHVPLGFAESAHYAVIEHERLSLISWPYEWGFRQLRDAAIFHLELQLELLGDGISLKDSSAFNVQFKKAVPIFIDALSFKKKEQGDLWEGYTQFCEEFLNPLLLASVVGLPFNQWYRGAVRGLDSDLLYRMLPLRKKISPRIFLHVTLPVILKKMADRARPPLEKRLSSRMREARGNEESYYFLLRTMRNLIRKLEDPAQKESRWIEYTSDCIYTDEQIAQKKAFVSEFVATTKPHLLLDVGSNTGTYSKLALENGAVSVVSVDGDPCAVDVAYSSARELGASWLPLCVDVANLTSSLGWAGEERSGFLERFEFDAVLALAVVHHLLLTAGIPLKEILRFLTDIASEGIIEFVPRDDPMFMSLCDRRTAMGQKVTYDKELFETLLSSRATILKSKKITDTGRTLYWFRRN